MEGILSAIQIMPKSRFSHDQIKAIVLEIGTAPTLKGLAHKHGISTATLHRWRLKVAKGQEPARQRLQSLEVEHRRLKNRYAELSLDYLSLRAALLKDVNREC